MITINLELKYIVDVLIFIFWYLIFILMNSCNRQISYLIVNKP